MSVSNIYRHTETIGRHTLSRIVGVKMKAHQRRGVETHLAALCCCRRGLGIILRHAKQCRADLLDALGSPMHPQIRPDRHLNTRDCQFRLRWRSVKKMQRRQLVGHQLQRPKNLNRLTCVILPQGTLSRIICPLSEHVLCLGQAKITPRQIGQKGLYYWSNILIARHNEGRGLCRTLDDPESCGVG